MPTLRKATGLRLPFELDKQITSIANKQSISKNAVMIHALQQYIERNYK